jgi:MoaA/NifB/PqqE/SkfB family radical SAM enzyme
MTSRNFSSERFGKKYLRLPLEGSIDLTYRCNNKCLHCWVLSPDSKEERRKELSTAEWIDIIDQARALGTREWMISGGEPMIRDDFGELFGYILKKSSYCSLNTNGTLITSALAKKMKETGIVMVSIYGATAEVHDQVTRHPGSYDDALRGIAYLKEAKVRFMVQPVPLKDNFHQWPAMKVLAQGLCPVWRIGATYISLSATGNKVRDEEIRAQRLAPGQVVAIDPPNIPYEERGASTKGCGNRSNERLYDYCIALQNSFHIDPYGKMSFCCLVKDERLRFDLKRGSFAESWDVFLPSLSKKEQECLVFDQNCLVCEMRNDCQRCPAQSYLEHRQAKVPSHYLCQFTKEKEKYKRHWKTMHRRYFQIAGITIEVNSEQEFQKNTFSAALAAFAVDSPGKDVIQLEHFYSLPEWSEDMLGKKMFQRVPWLIYNKGGTWSYVGYSVLKKTRRFHQLAVFTDDYSHGRLYSDTDYRLKRGNLNSVAMFPTDQVWLAQALLPRKAFYLHSCGLIVDGNGLLFIGHSRAGKSTIAKLFGDQAELLCDDRNIVRYWPKQGWRLYGTWSHGELSAVSPSSAPLKAVFFLDKSPENALIRLHDQVEIKKRLIPCLPRPFVDVKWWEGIWPLISKLSDKIPAFVIRFDKSGAIVPLIRKLKFDDTSKQVHDLE